MTTTEQKQKQEMVLPSFFYAIASSESRQLISLDELQRIITLDAMTQARTEDYRKNMRISSELAHQTKVMMPGITTSVLMDGRGKELRNVVKTTQMIAVDIDKIPAEKMKEVVQKADADPHTMMRFITVSQRGLRIISRYLPIDDDEVTALELFDVIIRKAMSYYSKLLGVPADEQCVDITRMCGLAHDPTAYFHWDAEAFGLNSIQIITDEENRRYSPWFVDNIESPRETPIDYQHVYAQAVALGQEVTNRVKNQEEGWVYWLTTVDIDVMREHNGMFMVSNFMEDQILRFYKVPKSDTAPQYVKFRYSSEIMERIGGSPALSRNMSHQNLSAVMQRLGFKKVHRAKGNGWLVIEKNPGEINTEAICSPNECAETYLKPYRAVATDSQNGSDQQ